MRAARLVAGAQAGGNTPHTGKDAEAKGKDVEKEIRGVRELHGAS